MSLSLVAIIGGIITSILAYISHLRGKITQNQNDLASMKREAQTKEWQDEIAKVTKIVVEKEVDYQKAAADFRAKYGDDDGSGNKSG